MVSLLEVVYSVYLYTSLLKSKRFSISYPSPPNKHREVRKLPSIHLIFHFLFFFNPQITGVPNCLGLSLVHFKLAIAYGIEHMTIPHTWMITKTYRPENLHTPDNLTQWGFLMYFLRVRRGTSGQNVLVYQTCVLSGCVRVRQ